MKASEVFDLPVSVNHPFTAEVKIGADAVGGDVCVEFHGSKQAWVAANCINHADALADALESMLEHEKEMAYSVWDYSEEGSATFEESSELARFNDSFADELAALAAYRGAN